MLSATTLRGMAPARSLSPWEPSIAHPRVRDASPALALGAAPASIARQAHTHRPHTPTAQSPVGAGAWLLFRFYKETFSRMDGNVCGFVPSCSRFGLEATQRHGLRGVAMTFGRLMRNHAHDDFYRPHPRGYLRDPVRNYTFFGDPPALDAFHLYDDPVHAWSVHVRGAQGLPKHAHPQPRTSP